MPDLEHDVPLSPQSATFFQRFPEHKFASVVLCNQSTANTATLAAKIAEIWLGNLMEPVKDDEATSKPPVEKLQPVPDADKVHLAGKQTRRRSTC